MSAGEFILEDGPLIYAAVMIPVLLAFGAGIVRAVLRDRAEAREWRNAPRIVAPHPLRDNAERRARREAQEDVRRRAMLADERDTTLYLYPSRDRRHIDVEAMGGRS